MRIEGGGWMLLAACLLVGVAGGAGASERVVVGSKKFTESYLLGEMMAQLLESRGLKVERRFGLGGTLVCYRALREGAIDVYAEYSGTIDQAVLKSPLRSTLPELRERLRRHHGLDLLEPFGFNNTYAIAVRRDTAEKLGLRAISDLQGRESLTYAFSHEFLERTDGWPGLSQRYELDARPRGIEHGLAYEAIDKGKIDVTDVYSTDGDILRYDLAVLADDRDYFPKYLAAPFVRENAGADVRRALNALGGRIDESTMRRLNGEILLEGRSFADVAGDFLRGQGLVASNVHTGRGDFWSLLAARTVRHLQLTLIALLAAILVAVPLGVIVYRLSGVSKVVVYVAGVLQTIPSIALLAFMIPLFGIGAVPAIVALFAYALLPILRNTTSALFSIDPLLRRVASGMGLTSWQRLRHVEVPLAVPTVLAGVKTAAVINIGTATLAAFIGAGGLGEPIVTGLALNDTRLILEGAVPAAALAVLTELVFDLIERRLVPRHLSRRTPG